MHQTFFNISLIPLISFTSVYITHVYNVLGQVSKRRLIARQ